MNIEIIKKIPWKKVIQIGTCVGAGIMAFSEAVGEQKKTEMIEGFEKRLSKLEGKKS